MDNSSRRRILSDSSDDDDESSDVIKEKNPTASCNNGGDNAAKNNFFSTNSGSDADDPCLSNKISNQLNNMSNPSDDSDENTSPILKRFPAKRRRLLSDDDISEHPFQPFITKATNEYQLSSSSEDEALTSKAASVTTSAFYGENSSVSTKKYVIPISRHRLFTPRSSADPVSNPVSVAAKSAHHASTKKKKHKRLKWLSSVDDDNIDETYQKDDFGSDSSFSDEEEGPKISVRMQEKILDLFQNSSEEELSTISQCSTKKAAVLVSLRPFKSWNDLLSKVDNNKLLGRNIVTSSIDLIQERRALCRLMEECSLISKKLEAEFDRLRDVDTQSPKKFCKDIVVQKQPENITSKFSLKPYQMIGLNWLALLHRNKVSGILADEMGLGKTIQTISFLAYLQNEGISDGPHLIIVPSSTLDNWIREFSVWCPSFSVVLYNGKPEDRRSLRIQLLKGYLDCNVILTTYNLAISAPEDRTLFKKLGVYYAVFDEGHMLKNMSTQRFQHLMRIAAEHRLLLTGTPLQNNLLELMSLLRFVMPHMFKETTSSLIRIFSHSGGDNSSTFAKQRISHAKLIMQPFVLRRLKNEVLHQLPKKEETICKCDLTPSQLSLYEKVKAKFKNKFSKQNMPKSELRNVFVELRKVANHPLLRREHYPDSTLRKMAKLLKNDVVYSESNEIYLFEDMQVMNDFELHRLCLTNRPIKKYKLSDSVLLDSGKFSHLDQILPQIKSDGKRILLFSQFTMMMDVIEVYLKLRGHAFLRLDGQTPVGDRLNLIDQFNNDTSYFAFILSTRAGGLGINLTSASVVILHDIDSNPYNDKQAEDRCHRLGQSKIVEVIKLIAKNTIEESMFRSAQYKLRLEKDMQEGDDAVDMAALITQSLE